MHMPSPHPTPPLPPRGSYTIVPLEAIAAGAAGGGSRASDDQNGVIPGVRSRASMADDQSSLRNGRTRLEFDLHAASLIRKKRGGGARRHAIDFRARLLMSLLMPQVLHPFPPPLAHSTCSIALIPCRVTVTHLMRGEREQHGEHAHEAKLELSLAVHEDQRVKRAATRRQGTGWKGRGAGMSQGRSGRSGRTDLTSGPSGHVTSGAPSGRSVAPPGSTSPPRDSPPREYLPREPPTRPVDSAPTPREPTFHRVSSIGEEGEVCS